MQTPPQPQTHPPLSALKIACYCTANFGFGAFYALNNWILPLWFAGYNASATVTGMLSDSSSLEGAIVQPVVGAWSDRLRSRYGRRRPFMLLFIPLSSALVLITPASAHLPVALRSVGMIASVILFTMCFNIAADPYQALLADLTPENQRSKVTGLWNFTGMLGQVAILLVPLSLQARFTYAAVVMLLATLWTCFTIDETLPDDTLAPVDGSGHSVRDMIHRHFMELVVSFHGLKTLKQAKRFLLMYFFYGLAVGAIQPHLSRFVQTTTGCSTADALKIVLAMLASAGAASVPFGWLTAAIGARTMMIAGTLFIAMAALGGYWVHTTPQIVAVLVFAGLGVAAQFASSFPLLTQVVPEEEVGYYTGLKSTAQSLSIPLSALFSGVLVDHALKANAGAHAGAEAFHVIFIVCFACIVLAALALFAMHPSRAVDEIERRREELLKGT